MAKGISVHIGLNRVDPSHYNNWDGRLNACEADAHAMDAVAKSKHMQTKVMLTQSATADAVKGAIASAAQHADSGDLFFLTYSGHGGQVPDRNGEERRDHMDETWVLYNRQLVDDELYALWGRFKPGVRILVLSDSCHSGTATRGVPDAAFPVIVERDMLDTEEKRYKDLPKDVQEATYEANKELYDSIQAENPPLDKSMVGASVLLISGCQDNQLSLDGDRNGLFTQHLLEVWNNGRFRGSYRRFQQAIGQRMPSTQSPNFFKVGASNTTFEGQTPLTV